MVEPPPPGFNIGQHSQLNATKELIYRTKYNCNYNLNKLLQPLLWWSNKPVTTFLKKNGVGTLIATNEKGVLSCIQRVIECCVCVCYTTREKGRNE